MALPLEGLKVLDLSRLLPGPYATLVLADLGATVDKIEDPNGGDYIRQMGPFKGDESALFLGLNRNKRSATLDLKSADGPATLDCDRHRGCRLAGSDGQRPSFRRRRQVRRHDLERIGGGHCRAKAVEQETARIEPGRASQSFPGPPPGRARRGAGRTA